MLINNQQTRLYSFWKNSRLPLANWPNVAWQNELENVSMQELLNIFMICQISISQLLLKLLKPESRRGFTQECEHYF